MKRTLLLLTVFFTQLVLAQSNPIIINNHGKGAYGIHAGALLGAEPLRNWSAISEHREYDYNGGKVAVEYPQLIKTFNFKYKNEPASGAFVIEYDRFQGKGYLKFQIFLMWADKSFSYFIGKQYGQANQVSFYESELDTGHTLDPNVDFARGGAKVWVIEVIDFGPLVQKFYDNFLTPLENDTKKALTRALNP